MDQPYMADYTLVSSFWYVQKWTSNKHFSFLSSLFSLSYKDKLKLKVQHESATSVVHLYVAFLSCIFSRKVLVTAFYLEHIWYLVKDLLFNQLTLSG